jgi:hypothetical protein
LKKSKLFNWFRHSRLNPYHTFLTNIKAPSLDEAREKAYELGKVQFLYKGTRYYSERHDCSVDEEYKKYKKVLRGRGDVSDRIPRDKNGNLDLYAEDPIVICIIPIEGPALIGHTGMQYRDRVMNRYITSIHTDPVYPKYEDYSEYYFVYPSKLGIDPKKLVREIDKYNIKYGDKKYSFLTNNCAKNVANVLRAVGVKDFDFYGPDKLGLTFTSPGNNPFNKGIKAWCFKHGVHVHPEEVEELHRRFPIPNVTERRTEMKEKRARYRAVVKEAQKRTSRFNSFIRPIVNCVRAIKQRSR